MEHSYNVSFLKSFYVTVLLFFFTLVISKSTNAQAPPACDVTVDLSTDDWVPQIARVLYSGEVLCITETGTYYGDITVEDGGHVVVCGDATIFGSVTVNPGGNYWHTANTGFIGSLSIYGDEHIGVSSCGNPSTCDCEDYIFQFYVQYTGPSGVQGGAYDEHHDRQYENWPSMQNGQIYSFDVSNSQHPGTCLLYTSPSPRD